MAVLRLDLHRPRVVRSPRTVLAASTQDRPRAHNEPSEDGVTRESKSTGGSVARGAVALLSTQPVTWAASLLLTIFLPRYLGAHALGQLTLAQTISGLAAVVGLFGMSDWLVRQTATQTGRSQGPAAIAVALVCGASLLLAVAVAGLLAVVGVPIARSALLPLVLLTMVATNVQTTLLAIFIGQERHGRYAWFNAVSMVATAAIGVGVLACGADIVGLAAAGLLVSLVSAAICWRASGIRIDRQAFTWAAVREVASGGLPFLGWKTVLATRGSVGVLLLTALLREQATGWWAAAGRVTGIPVFIPTVIATPLLPALSREAEDAVTFRRLLHRSLTTVLLLTVPVNALILALAPSVPDLLGWDASFLASVPLMMVLAIVQPLVAVDMVLGTALIALHDEHRWLRVSLVAAVLKPLMYLALIPAFAAWMQYGAVGAAVGEVLAELIMLGGALVLMPRRLLDPSVVGFVVRIVIAAAFLVVVVTMLRPVSVLLAIPAGGLAFVSAALVLELLSAEEIERVVGMLLQPLKRR